MINKEELIKLILWAEEQSNNKEEMTERILSNLEETEK